MADVVQGDGYTLYNADCLDVLPTLEAGSVDCVCADPPYGTTACRWDSVIPFAPMWAGIKHVVKPRAAVVLFGSQPFTSALVMSNAEWFRYTWVWDKGVSGSFACAEIMPLRTHEDICVFAPNKHPAYNPQMTKRKIPARIGGVNSKSTVGGREIDYNPNLLDRNKMYFWAYPKSVFYQSPRSDNSRGLHPTQKPGALLKYLVRTYTNEGDTVLDFTMGSGTTGVAALLTGRRFIGIELDTGYFQIACDRIADAARTARREWKPLSDVQAYDDMPLFQNGHAAHA